MDHAGKTCVLYNSVLGRLVGDLAAGIGVGGGPEVVYRLVKSTAN